MHGGGNWLVLLVSVMVLVSLFGVGKEFSYTNTNRRNTNNLFTEKIFLFL